MSQSRKAARRGRSGQQQSAQRIEDQSLATKLLDALDDDDCRAILAATSEEARSANELSDQCDLPLSTAYRKLSVLTEVGVLTEQTRISSNGKHASEYVRRMESVSVSVTAEGDTELTLSLTDEARESRMPAPAAD